MSTSSAGLLVASIVYGTLGLCGLLPAGFSVMMFDAGSINPPTKLLFWSIFTFPGVCLLAIVLAWALHSARANAPVHLLIHLPLVNILLAIIGFFWLKIVYGGRFDV